MYRDSKPQALLLDEPVSPGFQVYLQQVCLQENGRRAPVRLREAWSACARAAVRSGIVLALAAAVAGAAQAAKDVSITTTKRGSAVEVDARATLHVPLALIWETLTDYNHLAEFILGISRSRLREYRGTAAIVEQAGEARFLFFRIPINVVVESREFAPDAIEVRVLQGNLKQLHGRYQVETGAVPGGALTLHWFGVIEPEMPLLPVVGEMALRANVSDQFLGMVDEIERRHAKKGRRK